MIKTTKSSYKSHIICFFLKIVCICILIPVNASSSEEVDQGRLCPSECCGDHSESMDAIDGIDENDELPPKTTKKLVKILKSTIDTDDKKITENLIIKKKFKKKLRTQYYLNMQDLNDVNTVFLALLRIYRNNIKCDTATILLAYQLKGKQLNIQKLHAFLKARKSTPVDKDISYRSPYFKTQLLLFSKINIRVINLLTSTEGELPDILPLSSGSIIVLFTYGHASVVKVMEEGMYEYSNWNPTNGVYYKRNNIGRPESDGFKRNIGGYGFIKRAE